MTKTFAKFGACHRLKSGELGMMPFGTTAEDSFVWIFEFGSLGFVWDLVLGIFTISGKRIMFTKLIIYLLK